MSGLTRSVNRRLRETVAIEIARARTPRLALDSAWFSRLIYMNGLIERIADVEGDVVECGVATGGSLAAFATLLKTHRDGRHVWGFDSWAGLPPPSQADLGDSSIAAGGMFSYASTIRVHEELTAYGLTDREIQSTVTLVSGLFSETLPSFQERIALLHIDADLYQSYLDCLENLWPQVAVGGIVAFDEYGEPGTWPGARRAVDEFFATRSEEASPPIMDEISGKWWLSKLA